MDLKLFTDYKKRVIEGCEKVIVGKRDVIEKVLICYLCSGHILLEDVPGTGKTMLLRAFAAVTGGTFKRVQFTPDLLPSDLTGLNIFDQKSGEFEFRPGPIFANMVLGDEINRATPRTQSSLLEAMAEHQVSVDGKTYRMAEPFMIMATENPLESYGTFPLPEAQKDRFLMRLSMGYPSRADELTVLRREDTAVTVEKLTQLVTAEETAALKAQIDEVTMAPDVETYLLDIIEKTRMGGSIRTGVSTRGAIALYRTAKARAALSGRSYVQPEDVKAMAVPVLAHRIQTDNAGSMKEEETLIARLLDQVSVPTEDIKA
ncbi:MAG: AAA family ATPase [Lachnospiraceae bacterium]|nr:AAA family ATPase [Lachnospiraceae bacterium]